MKDFYRTLSKKLIGKYENRLRIDLNRSNLHSLGDGYLGSRNINKSHTLFITNNN